MKNKLGTTGNMVEYHENGKKSYEFITDKYGLITEAIYDKNGYTLSYKDYCEKVTQEEYDAFIQSLEKPKQQTAVEWLIQKITLKENSNENYLYPNISKKDIEQALEIEKEQKIDFAKKCLDKALDLDIRTSYGMVEEYYNQTYNSNQATFGYVFPQTQSSK